MKLSLDRQPFGVLTWPVVIFTLWLGVQRIAADLALAHGADGLAINDYVKVGRDFVNVWLGGQLAAAGDVATIYDIDAYRRRLDETLGIQGIYAYSYPPHSLFLALPFGSLPYGAALAAWQTAGLLLFMAAARPYLREAGLPVWWAVAMPASLINIWASHYGFFIGAAVLAGWRALASAKHGRAGVAFGLATLKPHLGLTLALALLFRREWRTIGWAVAVTAVLVAASATVFGGASWTTYLFKSSAFHASLVSASTGGFLQMMPTALVTMLQAGVPDTAALVVQAGLAVFAVAILWRTVARAASVTDTGLIAGSAVFLVLPYAFIYDMTVHGLAMLVFAARLRPDQRVERIVLAIAFLVPVLQMPLGAARLPLAPIILAAALWIAHRVAVSRTPSSDAPGTAAPA